MSSSIESISAQNSLKRSRILHDVNPQSAFVPMSDPSLLQASINRRKRRVKPKQQQQQGTSSNALALISDGTSDNTMKPITPGTQADNRATSSALVLADQGGNDETTQQNSGILTVRVYVFQIISIA